MASNNFSNKLNFEPKTVVFIEKEYTVKTDHKTGLLIQAMMREQQQDSDEKLIKLALGDKQMRELYAELEAAGAERGGENWMENSQAIVIGLMSVLYNRPYEDFAAEVKKAQAAGK